MTHEKEISIATIGNVTLRKSNRAKHLSIKIKPAEGVSVTIPKRVSFIEGELFAVSKQKWILKHLPKVENYEKRRIKFDESTKYKTKHHTLVIIKGKTKQSYVKIFDSLIEVVVAENMDISSEKAQSIIKFGITEALRIEAKKYIPNRVEELSKKFGFKYNKVFLKNLRSRWGSCSWQNNINLNIHLMRLPYELIDYVILHELAHTIHKNHSKLFWGKLEDVITDSKIFDKQMKNYSLNYF